MSVFEHARFAIFSPVQHPLVHDIGSFGYVNPALPSSNTLQGALDYIVAFMYPKYIGTFPDVASLPALATSNDYAVVSDDGDGKAAGYVWFVIDGVAGWQKRYDVDFGVDNILEEYANKTAYMYVMKYGANDLDAAGNPIVGLYAGQKIYGGSSASNNLTLLANSGNVAPGTHTGFVQVDDNFRPTINNTFDSGTTTERWKKVWTQSIAIGTMTISGGSLVDSSGTINFGSTALTTTGNITGNVITGGVNSKLADITFSNGSITSLSADIDFGSNNLKTTGTITSGVIATKSGLNDLTLDAGAAVQSTIISSLGQISFGSNNLITTGTFNAASATFTSADFGNIHLAGNTVSITNLNGDLILLANGTGKVTANSSMQTTTLSVLTGGFSVANGLNADLANLRVSGNQIAATNLNGSINLLPNGTGQIGAGSTLFPTVTDAYDLGKSGNNFLKVWVSGSIGTLASEILVPDLLTLRNVPFRDLARTIPAQAGDALFWDSVNQVWLADHPDSEITHDEIAGLTTGDAGHTQFAMLAGRVGGQTIQGGTAASENLTLESTAHATKGNVFTKDPFKPFTDASFLVSWQGTDIGGSSNYFRHVYTKGEHFGFRFENTTTGSMPGASSQNKGRMVFATDTNKIYVDTGGAWIPAGVSKFQSDTSWDGTITFLDVDVSATISDARTAVWQILDNANNFDRIYCDIEATSASNVRIIVGIPLPAGSYRLLGLA